MPATVTLEQAFVFSDPWELRHGWVANNVRSFGTAPVPG